MHGDEEEMPPENGMGGLGEPTGSENPKADQPGKEEKDENIPEWLKRVRELKKADQPVEEVDQWQQEKLFAGLAQDKKGNQEPAKPVSRPAKPSDAPAPKPVVPEDQPMLEEAPASETTHADEEEIIKPDGSEDELPEGFTPL